MRGARLIDVAKDVFIIAHEESTGLLEGALSSGGFNVRTIRGPYSAAQADYSAQMKCLVNHSNAWKLIVGEGRPAIVVEADFVPVRNFGQLPSPTPPLEGKSTGFAWLYSAGSILYGFDEDGFPHGHGNTTVAYVVNPKVASLLIAFCEREESRSLDGAYRQWETYLGIYLRREHGIRNYIPTYQFGEHGGLPNREHLRHGIRAWHQADVLWGKLAFAPGYAAGSRWRYSCYRMRAWSRAWARVVLLKFYNPKYVHPTTSRGRLSMAVFSVARLLHAARTR